tara:strand:- start:117 stop:326 length:210 start_codon:yes stop_codon:yes gene_type:complete
VKKNIQKIASDNSEIISKNKIINDNIKTTNVNILLNRVRLDRERTIKKRFLFSFILIVAVSALAVNFII